MTNVIYVNAFDKNINQLLSLDISDASDKDSTLIMYIGNKYLDRTEELFTHFGYKYLTVLFVIMGKNIKFCFIGKKGKGCKVISKKLSQIYTKNIKDIKYYLKILFGDVEIKEFN